MAMPAETKTVEQKWRDGEWCTDLGQAPRGQDVLVAMRAYSPNGECNTQIGILLWEPADKEPDETDADIDGYFGEHDGQMGIWYWHCGEDGPTDKKYLAAWRPMPPLFVVDITLARTVPATHAFNDGSVKCCMQRNTALS